MSPNKPRDNSYKSIRIPPRIPLKKGDFKRASSPLFKGVGGIDLRKSQNLCSITVTNTFFLSELIGNYRKNSVNYVTLCSVNCE
jgi:hypothetical protein